MRERLTDEDELYRRGLSSITCRPGAGQTSTVPEPRNRARFGGNTNRSPRCRPTKLQRGASDRETEQNPGRLDWELVMNNCTARWILWFVLMAVFTGLTLTSRWTDLALALTIGAVVWYGIVPEPRSGRQ